MATKFLVYEVSNPGNILAVRDTHKEALAESTMIDEEFDRDTDVKECAEEELPAGWEQFYAAN